jgi:hypothetical protein
MSKAQQHPGTTDQAGNSSFECPVVHVNTAGGSSQLVEDHPGNRFGAPIPASFEAPSDGDHQPYVIHRAHFDSDGQQLSHETLDHSPSRGAIPSPTPLTKGSTKKLNADGTVASSSTNSDSPAPKQAKTSGAIGRGKPGR